MASDYVASESLLLEALSSPLSDAGTLRELVGHNLIPSQLRGEIWKVLLGVRRKPTSAIDSWNGELDLPEQPLIAAECENVRSDVNELSQDVRMEMQGLLTVFCKLRAVKYRKRLAELLAPIALLRLPRGETFNCFYALVSKFLPTLFEASLDDLEHHSMQWFQLLLQYHDSELSSCLEQRGLFPETYAPVWLRSLLTHKVSLPVTYILWDRLLLNSDPCAPYFVALALLEHFRDTVLPVGAEQIADTVRTLPSLLSDEIDVLHVCERAAGLEQITPKSFKQALIANILNPRRTTGPLPPPPMCLTVTPQEVQAASVVGSRRGPEPTMIKFVVLDCRTLAQFEAGHMPVAFHIDPAIMETRLEEFVAIIDGFKGMRGSDHFCLFGSGVSEDDDFLRVVSLHLRQHSFPYVSVVQGGYLATHALTLEGKLQLMDHTPSLCALCPKQEEKKVSGGFFGGFRGKLTGFASSLRSTLETVEQKLEQAVDSGLKKFEPSPPQETISSSPKVGPTTASAAPARVSTDTLSQSSPAVSTASSPRSNMFALDDSDIVDEVSRDSLSFPDPPDTPVGMVAQAAPQELREIPAPTPGDPIPIDGTFALRSWVSLPSITVFPARSMTRSGALIPRYLVISQAHLIVLESNPAKTGFVSLKWQEPLSSIAKVTYNRKASDVLSFTFREGSGVGLRVFKMDTAAQCIDVIKARLAKLRG